MGRLILCYSKKATKPYFIKNMNINLYTIEELCYYLYHNIYLIDENVINDELILWIDKELELTGLSELLNTNRGSIKNVLINILTYTGYVSKKDLEETDKLLTKMDGQSNIEKKLARADHLLQCKKYVEAILEYRLLMDAIEEDQKEKIWNNMGVAYASMFLFCEAAKCFKIAYEIGMKEELYKQFLFAVAMSSKEEVTDIIQDIKEDYNERLKEELDKILQPETNSKLKQFHDVLNHKKENRIAAYYKGLEDLLEEWKKEYINLTL